MKAFVFTDASLSSRAGQFVWLSLDGENPRNAAVVKRLKVSAYPTLFVIDPATEQVAIRWLGGATLPQLGTLLESGRAAIKSGRSGMDAQLALADSLYGVEDYAGAQRELDHVLSVDGSDGEAIAMSAAGAPFRIIGDCAWSVIAQLEKTFTNFESAPARTAMKASGEAAGDRRPRQTVRAIVAGSAR